MNATRRKVLATAGAVVALPVAANMSSCPSIDVITTLSQFYQKVQDLVVGACAAYGKAVPTIDFILQITAEVLGKALTTETLPAAVAALQAIVDSLAKQCPQGPAAPGAAGEIKKWY